MMIEFDGSISKKNQLDRMKKVNKEEIRIFLFALIFIWIVAIAIGLPLKILQDLWGKMIVCSFIFLGITFLSVKIPKKVVLRFRLSPHIIITEKDLSLELWSNGEKVWRRRNLSKVKKILNCGEVYYIVFKFGGITNAWICQKDNIINGTIKDFETLFQSKIIREFK